MKRCTIFLLMFGFLYGCSVSSSKPLLKKSPYEADFRYFAQRLEGKKRKVKHIKKLEFAYQSAQKADLMAADSMLNLDNPDRWLYIHAYYGRMQARQKKLLSLLPLEPTDGSYTPDFLIVGNLEERELASRRASAQYLYQQAQDLLATGSPARARDAYGTLTNLSTNYFPVWEQSQALRDSALALGTEHILVESDFSLTPGFMNSQWQKFYRNRSARETFDVVIRTMDTQVFVGPDMESSNSYSESKQIQVGTEEKKDSAGHVIERTPIYETVTATVTELEITKTADASVWVEILDGRTGALIQSQILSDQHLFRESRIYVEGDARALSKCVMTNNFSISVPTYWDMERQVLDKLNTDFEWFAKSRLWTN